MQPLVSVMGATGNVGRALTAQLLRNGVHVRAVGRDAAKLAALRARGADVYAGDLENTAFMIEALRGADAVFAMLPEHPAVADFMADKHRMAAQLVEAVQAARVPRVVALSFIGVAPPSGVGPGAANGAFEDMLQSIKGLSVVALRPTYFMENLLGSIPLIQQAGINSGAFHADTTLPMITVQDVAGVAAEYLLMPTFEGYTARNLLGPRDYTLGEATAILGAAIDKPDLPYVPCSYADFRQALMHAGCSASAAEAIADIPRGFNEGSIRYERTATNTTPTTLETFARNVFAPVYGAGSPALP